MERIPEEVVVEESVLVASEGKVAELTGLVVPYSSMAWEMETVASLAIAVGSKCGCSRSMGCDYVEWPYEEVRDRLEQRYRMS